jgi:hypothetical protein
MYVSGIPMGMITDRKSPRLSGLIGTVALFAGYFPIHVGTSKQEQGLYMGIGSRN